MKKPLTLQSLIGSVQVKSELSSKESIIVYPYMLTEFKNKVGWGVHNILGITHQNKRMFNTLGIIKSVLGTLYGMHT